MYDDSKCFNQDNSAADVEVGQEVNLCLLASILPSSRAKGFVGGGGVLGFQ